MKKTGVMVAALLALLLAVILTGCGANDSASTDPTAGTGTETPAADTALSGVVKTGGSTSVEKVMNALIYQFQDDNREVTIDYEPNGSGDGIKNTISGLYEIGHSSRELKTDGTEDGLDATAYAIDGIAIVVNKDNTTPELSKDQVKDIYAGTITNWEEVGGPDSAITVITRESGSGTRDAFSEIVGLEEGGSNIVSSASVADNTGAIQTQVSQNPNAIGYMSFSDVDTSKVNTVAYEGIAISTDTLKDGSYGLKREFYLLTKTGATLSPAAQGFIDFVMGSAGQQIVADNSLLPIQ
jgi:phosphate transport system substrate-binding protein